MSPHPQSRRDAARARAAERKLAEQAAARRARAAARYGMGPLRDRVVRPRTLQQYKKAVKDFYKWQRVNGLGMPTTVLGFPTRPWADGPVPQFFSGPVGQSFLNKRKEKT